MLIPYCSFRTAHSVLLIQYCSFSTAHSVQLVLLIPYRSFRTVLVRVTRVSLYLTFF
eukprot:COSAG02_NODE_122_length_35306_cov_98.280967_5_plen_57_part_00